ncbi:PEP-CTERM sorting domain-containing protein [Thiobacillus sp.]|uniref:PEP-CTERM sorting domain-containing protein n=1 Tax=Thiobacillus sp. TaxID=924 RepID=UPI0017A98171|nr:PEP-CTERM sorting domain-containing protein [Thiobacillus sp.]MBC2729475.1 PEP-CTERM sorting domain-containing protein [Thiobacillus sp.]MBC2738210.1 PEP-CTERM sorting domain-containing protein [Thiobacillus sp.]MBC2761610.1 PEP-CTERM sorting domain-containing protein [Thiobacillus sp.]
MSRKPSASRARTRRIGLLGLLLAAALTPAGILIGTVTAAALVGGLALHLDHARPAPPAAIAPPFVAKQRLHPLAIEHKGETLSLVMAESDFADGGNLDPFILTGPSPSNPAGNGAAPDRMENGMPGPGRAPGGKPDRARPLAPSHPPSGEPAGIPPGDGSFFPAGKPQGSPATPPQASGPSNPPPGGPHSPEHNGPTGGSGAPGTPTSPDDAPGGNMPPNPFPVAGPGSWTPSQTDTPLGPPSGLQAATQPHAVPEPSVMGLMALGIAALLWMGRRRTMP